MENIRLKNTIATRLTNPEHKRLNLLSQKRNTNKSELIREIISRYLWNEQTKIEILTPKL